VYRSGVAHSLHLMPINVSAPRRLHFVQLALVVVPDIFSAWQADRSDRFPVPLESGPFLLIEIESFRHFVSFRKHNIVVEQQVQVFGSKCELP
jgi:hypothetical protein